MKRGAFVAATAAAAVVPVPALPLAPEAASSYVINPTNDGPVEVICIHLRQGDNSVLLGRTERGETDEQLRERARKWVRENGEPGLIWWTETLTHRVKEVRVQTQSAIWKDWQ